jgi:hypothetical protein
MKRDRLVMMVGRRMRKSKPKSSAERSLAHRARTRAKGYRRVELWLPDTRTPEFAAQAHRESLAIANCPSEADDQAFVDAISAWSND